MIKNVNRYAAAFLAALVLSFSFSFSVFAYDLNDAPYSDDTYIDYVLYEYYNSYESFPDSYLILLAYYAPGQRFLVCFLEFISNGDAPSVSIDYDDKSLTSNVAFSGAIHRFGTRNTCDRNTTVRTTDNSLYFYNTEGFQDGFRVLTSHNVNIISSDDPEYISPVSVDISLSSELTFSYYLNDNAVLPSLGEYIYIEFFDRAPAIPSFVWKPYKYVNYISGTTSVDDYIKVVSPSPKDYSFSYETFEVAGLEADHPYEARVYIMPNYANVIGPVKPIEIACYEFRLSEDGFYEIVSTGPKRYRKRKDPETGEEVLEDVDTGEIVDPDDIVYGFNSDLNLDYSETDFEVPEYGGFYFTFNESLLSGAGLVKKLFDKMIDSAGIYSYVTAVLAISVAGWFVFGSRR